MVHKFPFVVALKARSSQSYLNQLCSHTFISFHRCLILAKYVYRESVCLEVTGRHSSHLWGNWRHKPGSPSCSQARAGRPPQAGPPSCTGTLGFCTAAHKPLGTELPLTITKQSHRPLRGSPWAPRFHPQPPECTAQTWRESWSKWNQVMELKF